MADRQKAIDIRLEPWETKREVECYINGQVFVLVIARAEDFTSYLYARKRVGGKRGKWVRMNDFWREWLERVEVWA